jgi:CDP-diacylglycerol--glycerol-3-phosphate 3-phosphatidyltransferase
MANRQRSEIHKPQALQQLQKQWALLAALAAVSTLACAAALSALWLSENALRWGFIAGVVLIYQLIFTRRGLTTNHRLGEADLLPTFGLGSVLTMLRGVFFAWTAGFICSPRPDLFLAWVPVILYTAAIILDLIDGYVARLQNYTTNLGAALDTELDALGLLIAISLAVWYGTLPLWFLPIGAARYAFMFGIWLRQRRDLSVYDLPPSTSRRPIAGLTMGFTSAMLWPIVTPPGSILAGVIFLVPFTFSFTRDWLVVSGVLDPQGIHYQKWRTSLRKFLLQWIPLVVRAVLLMTVGIMSLMHLDYIQDPYSTAQDLDNLTLLLLTSGTIMVGLGFAGRFAAFVMIFPVSFTILDVGLNPLLAIILLSNLVILLLGTGAFSLWEPEKKIFGRRWGAE